MFRICVGTATFALLVGCSTADPHFDTPILAAASCQSSCGEARDSCTYPITTAFGCESAHARCVADCQRFTTRNDRLNRLKVN